MYFLKSQKQLREGEQTPAKSILEACGYKWMIMWKELSLLTG